MHHLLSHTAFATRSSSLGWKTSNLPCHYSVLSHQGWMFQLCSRLTRPRPQGPATWGLKHSSLPCLIHTRDVKDVSFDLYASPQAASATRSSALPLHFYILSLKTGHFVYTFCLKLTISLSHAASATGSSDLGWNTSPARTERSSRAARP